MASSFEEAFKKANNNNEEEVREMYFIDNLHHYGNIMIKINADQVQKLNSIKLISGVSIQKIVISNIEKFNQTYNFEMIDRIKKYYSLHKGHEEVINKNVGITNYLARKIITKLDLIISQYCEKRGCSNWGLKSCILRFIIEKIVQDFEKENPNVDLLGIQKKIEEEEDKIPCENKGNILSTSSIKDELPENQATRKKINSTIETVSDIMTFAKDVNELVKRFKHRELIQDRVDVFVKGLYSLTKDIINSQEQNFNK